MKVLAPCLLIALSLGGCAGRAPIGVVAPPRLPAADKAGWQAIVSDNDRERIAALPDIWQRVLAAVPNRARRMVAGEGDLLVANAARDHPVPTPGSYMCRLVRLDGGGTEASMPKSFPKFFCYVGSEGDRLTLTKQTGTELPGGWLHPDGARRLVMTGAMQRSAGDNALSYGDDPERDLVGVVERIGPFRWRLVIPTRAAQPGVDVYELTPVPLDRQAPEPAGARKVGAG